ncbi:MAG: pyrimidine 5'-nucleotidase [Alphaproteobacteria bacterium]|nr:pyrimidine 5'-nucleotidase [Alphaproteobacteria bacterium]
MMHQPEASNNSHRLRNAETWLFDLDNTLYPAHSDLFAQIDQRMAAFIGSYLGVSVVEARTVQKAYWASHGTTLNGLMSEHRMPPEPFLEFVHDIDVSGLAYDPRLDTALSRLPGRKIIFTNGTVRHAENVLRSLKLMHHFENIFDIAATGYVPKPHAGAYHHVVTSSGIRAAHTVMVDDSVKNLLPAFELGMTTIWASGKPEWSGPDPQPDAAHIHHVTDDIGAFLDTLFPVM